jgi:hypothetical protein
VATATKKAPKKSVKKPTKKSAAKATRATKAAPKVKPSSNDKPEGFDYGGDKTLASMLERYTYGENALALQEEMDLKKYPPMKNRIPLMELMRRHLAAVSGVPRAGGEFQELWSRSESGPMFHRNQMKGKAISKPELQRAPDDSKVPVIDNTKTANGWKSISRKGKDHFVSPELKSQGFEAGCVFVLAHPRAKADLIVVFPEGSVHAMPAARLKLIERPQAKDATKAKGAK